MHCERCGKKLKDGALFCENCGTKVPQQSGDVKEVGVNDFANQQPASQQPESKPDTSGVDVSAYPTAVQSPVGAPVFPATSPIPPVENGEHTASEPAEQEKKKKLKKPLILAVVAAVIILIAVIVLVVSFVSGDGEQEAQDSGAKPIRGYTSVQEMENAKSVQNDKTNSEQTEQNDQSGSTTNIEDVINGPHGYILPESDTRYYSESELNALTDYELYLARNEIYARHGREFNNQDLQDYFKNKDWYTARYSPESFDSIVTLNAYEKKNADDMLAIEKRRGSSYLS